MDHQHQQQQQQPVSPLQAGFPPSIHLLQHQMLQSQPQPHQQSPQQGSDPAAQDVLAEARKNLQALIDSGISRDLLHQQLALLSPSALPSQQLLQQPQQHHLPQQQQPAQRNHESHQMNHSHNHHHNHQHQHHQSAIPLAPTYQPPPPPAPQCPPPPVPTLASNNHAATAQPTPVSSGPSPPVAVSAPMDTKPEMIPEDGSASATWAPQGTFMTSSSMDDALFMQQVAAPFSHRPRISVSSTSSGSSGHASIWSTNSAQSTMSWQSGTTAPPMPVPTGAPLIKGTQIPQVTHSAQSKNTNIYWCTSCETSFKRKYDWKRHEDEFHERWRKYPCPEPGCNRSFWGSNSFNQHHKQCHGCTTCPHAEKVVRFLRKRKYWACGFCSALHPARERHVEHVARHFESGLTKADWMHSRVIYGLLHQPLIHEAWEAVVTSKHPDRRPQFSWHPGKTGRAQGFLEKENPGQLQDLLEFFCGEEGETQAQWVVGVAYELADVVTNNGNNTDAPLPPAPTQDNAMGPPPPPQDSRMSFVPFTSQAPQHQPGMMTAQDSHGSHAFASQYRGPVFLPSQAFPAAHTSSPDSSSHSPLTAAQSPLTATTSPGDKRDMPLPRAPQESSDSMMDFEYSPAPIVFEDWESLAGHMMDDAHHHGPPSAQQTWGMTPQYFTNDPRVPS